MIKRRLTLITILLISTGCSTATPSAEQVQTAIALTQINRPIEIIVTETITPLLSATARPIPTDTPFPSDTPLPTFTATQKLEPIIYYGTGDKVIDIEIWPGPAIAKISYIGPGNFAIWTYDDQGERIDLLVNTIGNYQGTRPFQFLNDDPRVARFAIEATLNWEIQLLPVDQMRFENIPGMIEGVGDDVIFLDGEKPDLLNVNAPNAESNFAVWTIGNNRDLVINEIAPYVGTVPIDQSTFLLVIESSGPWELDITTR